ncbi:MAG: hypothetical protein IKS54_00305 [Erysipelotrichaceae bacterium]|nr:hypothetical protein [Erysipelotrichaceae bacterium]
MNKAVYLLFLIGLGSFFSRLVFNSDHVFVMYGFLAYLVLICIGYVVKLKR